MDQRDVRHRRLRTASRKPSGSGSRRTRRVALDDLVGDREYRWRETDADPLRDLQVDDKLRLRDALVRDDCPPMFLVQAADDQISNIANTAILADACRAVGIPVERHVLPSGGHGFDMGLPDSPSAAWPDWYNAWLRAHRMRA